MGASAILASIRRVRRGFTPALAAMKRILLLLLLVLPAQAWACSCLRTASIEDTIASHPILVEAQVVSLEEVNSPTYGRQVRSATLRVRKVLKGSVTAESIVVEHVMCYASLYPGLMKLEHVYVLPLTAPVNGRHALAGCAHSGMELANGNLYTFEQAKGAQRRLQFYKKYSRFLGTLKKLTMHPGQAADRCDSSLGDWHGAPNGSQQFIQAEAASRVDLIQASGRREGVHEL